jgi:hypothetical protein
MALCAHVMVLVMVMTMPMFSKSQGSLPYQFLFR